MNDTEIMGQTEQDRWDETDRLEQTGYLSYLCYTEHQMPERGKRISYLRKSIKVRTENLFETQLECDRKDI